MESALADMSYVGCSEVALRLFLFRCDEGCRVEALFAARRPCFWKEPEEERCGDEDVVWVRETRVIAAADDAIASHQQPC
jgi:hypothetical protein